MAAGDENRNPSDIRFLMSAVDLVAATQSDTVNEPGGVSKGILLDATGDLEIVTEKGTVVLLSSLAAGMIHPIRVRRVNATNTTIADSDIFLAY